MATTDHAATELTLHLLQNPDGTDSDAYDLIARLCPRGAHDLVLLTLHLAQATADLLEEQCGDRNAAIEALQRHADATKTRVLHQPAGWTIPTLAPGPQLCTTNHTPEHADLAPCTDTAVWKVVEHWDNGGSFGLTLSFWCDTHLPAEHRPAA